MITRRRAWLPVVATAIALTAMSPASALDGEVLIDMAAVAAGGISPADDPGFPVTISRTGKYKLTGNLNVPAGTDGFSITGDNVTIDLNGFRLVGGRFGINAAGSDGLTVKNGTIANASRDGIRARGFAIVQDMNVVNNGGGTGGMGVKLNNNGRVIGSTISGNEGINVYCISRCLIASNVVTASQTESGIGLFSTAGGHLVLGNAVDGNALFGIYAEGATGFANNTLTANNSGGAQIAGPTGAHPNYCDPACP